MDTLIQLLGTLHGNGAAANYKHVYTAADKKVIALISVDISAAFDTIDHYTLIDCLESRSGVDSAASNWLHSYLSGRQQIMRLGSHSSTTTQCVSGVPHGSMLRPLLFTAYMQAC